MALNGKGNARFTWPGLVVGAWYELELRQEEHGGAVSHISPANMSSLTMLQFVFEVIVDGMKVFSKENSQVHSHCKRYTVHINSSFQAMEFEKMKVYASDPWYEPLPGQMKDLQYSNSNH